LLLSRILSAAKVSTMLLDVACIGKGMHRILNKCSAKSDERSSSDEGTHLTRVLVLGALIDFVALRLRRSSTTSLFDYVAHRLRRSSTWSLLSTWWLFVRQRGRNSSDWKSDERTDKPSTSARRTGLRHNCPLTWARLADSPSPYG
jgi:hypothetical protein